MDTCDQHNLVLHDFNEVFEKLTMVKLDLEQASLSEGFKELQKAEKLTYKMYL